jgi:hypothetical protein
LAFLDTPKVVVEMMRYVGHFLKVLFLETDPSSAGVVETSQSDCTLKSISELASVPDRTNFCSVLLYLEQLLGILYKFALITFNLAVLLSSASDQRPPDLFGLVPV